MTDLSASETLIHYGAFGALQFGEALSAAAEARRLRGAYEQFAAIQAEERSIAVDGGASIMPSMELILSPAEVAFKSSLR
jgi:hypothetical protein